MSETAVTSDPAFCLGPTIEKTNSEQPFFQSLVGIERGPQWGRQGYSKAKATRLLGAVFLEAAQAKTACEKHQLHSMAARNS